VACGPSAASAPGTGHNKKSMTMKPPSQAGWKVLFATLFRPWLRVKLKNEIILAFVERCYWLQEHEYFPTS